MSTVQQFSSNVLGPTLVVLQMSFSTADIERNIFYGEKLAPIGVAQPGNNLSYGVWDNHKKGRHTMKTEMWDKFWIELEASDPSRHVTFGELFKMKERIERHTAKVNSTTKYCPCWDKVYRVVEEVKE